VTARPRRLYRILTRVNIASLYRYNSKSLTRFPTSSRNLRYLRECNSVCQCITRLRKAVWRGEKPLAAITGSALNIAEESRWRRCRTLVNEAMSQTRRADAGALNWMLDYLRHRSVNNRWARIQKSSASVWWRVWFNDRLLRATQPSRCGRVSRTNTCCKRFDREFRIFGMHRGIYSSFMRILLTVSFHKAQGWKKNEIRFIYLKNNEI